MQLQPHQTLPIGSHMGVLVHSCDGGQVQTAVVSGRKEGWRPSGSASSGICIHSQLTEFTSNLVEGRWQFVVNAPCLFVSHCSTQEQI